MPVAPLRVAIVGCGTAGPAAALWLARSGHRVEIFERAPALEPVGAGFLLQPTGMWALEDLGLLAAVAHHGARVERLVTRTRRGRAVIDLPYRLVSPGAFGLGLHRATLLSLLVEALRREGVALHLDCDVDGTSFEGSARWLRLDGAQLGPFDLVLIASGARSAESLRSEPDPSLGVRSRTCRWGALWTIAPDRAARFTGRLLQVVDGARSMAGVLPTGTRRDDPGETPLVSLFFSLLRADLDETRRRGLGALTEDFLRLVPDAAAALSEVTSMHHWTFAEYRDVVMRSWHAPGLAVLGDAAHATSPQLGQGVNLALWDARELALALAVEDTLPAALSRYGRVRRRPVAFYQRASRWLTPLFQSRIPGAGAARDLALPWAARIPWVERQMALTMAGMKTGWLASLPWREEAPAETGAG